MCLWVERGEGVVVWWVSVCVSVGGERRGGGGVVGASVCVWMERGEGVVVWWVSVYVSVGGERRGGGGVVGVSVYVCGWREERKRMNEREVEPNS